MMNKYLFRTGIGQVFSILFLFISALFYAQSSCNGFTLTPGGWGNTNENNPNYQYLEANFGSKFPNGLTIGCDTGNKLSLSSAAAVRAFLPASGSPGPLNGNYSDPVGYKNTLASHLVCVVLALGFDRNSISFGNLIINDPSSPFNMMTVNQFVSLANDFIGGCGSSSYTTSQFTAVAEAINLSFDNGVNNGYLTCCKVGIDVSFDKILCNGGSTTVHVKALNGTSGATGIGDFVVNAGTYTYTVTDGNCTASKTIAVTEPSKLELNIQHNEIKCNGENATITLTASGGTVPYTYSNGSTIVDVKAGTYSYTVTDANGCSVTKEITITEPPKLVASVTTTPIMCHGGKSKVTVSATGGTEPYTGTGEFEVDAGKSYTYTVTDQNRCSATVSTEVITEPTQLDLNVTYTPIKCNGEKSTVTVTATGGTEPYTITGDTSVSAGTYTYTVTDKNGCTVSKEITIKQPDLLQIKIEATKIMCNGGQSQITVTAFGGTGNITGTGTFTVKASATPYSYTVTDENGCTATASIKIEEPVALAISLDTPDVFCIGGTSSVTANVSGGTKPYSYAWSNGSTGNPVTLGAGNYTLTITDGNGCSASTSFTVKLKSCGGFTTVTPGGWGAKASGNNWGTYRDKYFAGAFPSGLTIGSNGRYIKLTTSKAVMNFLPSSTTPRALENRIWVDPGNLYKNVLAGQVVALTLNVTFDDKYPTFSTSATQLGDLVVVFGTFAGMTVRQILNEANKILGGLPSAYSAAEINSTVDGINNNYDNGTTNNGLLACPCSSIGTGRSTETAKALENVVTEPKVELYPNPSHGEFNLNLELPHNSPVTVKLYNMTGKMVSDLSTMLQKDGNASKLRFENNNLPEGMYIIIIHADNFDKTLKLIIRK